MFMKLFIWIIFLVSFLSYLYFYKNLFMTIMSIEFMIISLGLVIFFFSNLMSMEYFMLMFFIVSVIESLIMLCLLISYVMDNGSDDVVFLHIIFL
uniref:NADH-ubiquinone oxidoreductase chain 4L n=1 Tax=Sceliphron madraspatanum TaxID=2008740 RepID=A0A343DRG2_9HYME|nr:NADH dehydrogenase subunit 4L [Sceliphron madraspatanum]